MGLTRAYKSLTEPLIPLCAERINQGLIWTKTVYGQALKTLQDDSQALFDFHNTNRQAMLTHRTKQLRNNCMIVQSALLNALLQGLDEIDSPHDYLYSIEDRKAIPETVLDLFIFVRQTLAELDEVESEMQEDNASEDNPYPRKLLGGDAWDVTELERKAPRIFTKDSSFCRHLTLACNFARSAANWCRYCLQKQCALNPIESFGTTPSLNIEKPIPVQHIDDVLAVIRELERRSKR